MGSKNAGEPMLPLVLEPKRKAFYGDLDFCLGLMQAGEEWSVKREETAYEEQIF